MASNLTLISTFGWYTDDTIQEELTPISTFGWYFDPIIVDSGDIIHKSFCLFRNITMQLNR